MALPEDRTDAVESEGDSIRGKIVDGSDVSPKMTTFRGTGVLGANGLRGISRMMYPIQGSVGIQKWNGQ